MLRSDPLHVIDPIGPPGFSLSQSKQRFKLCGHSCFGEVDSGRQEASDQSGRSCWRCGHLTMSGCFFNIWYVRSLLFLLMIQSSAWSQFYWHVLVCKWLIVKKSFGIDPAATTWKLICWCVFKTFSPKCPNKSVIAGLNSIKVNINMFNFISFCLISFSLTDLVSVDTLRSSPESK